jgi:hypothetical protein
MKTALCIYGMFKEFPRVVRSWKFLNHIDYDVYFSTYSINVERSDRLEIHVIEPVNKSDIISAFPSAGLVEINFSDYYGDKFIKHLGHNSNRMLYHWKKCWEMLIRADIKYDRVILIRPDLLLLNLNESLIPALTCNVDDYLYGLSPVLQAPPPTFLGTVDNMFIGNMYTIGRLIKQINYIEDHDRYFEYHLCKFLINNDIYVEPLGVRGLTSTVVRSNSRELFEMGGDNFDNEFVAKAAILTGEFAKAKWEK